MSTHALADRRESWSALARSAWIAALAHFVAGVAMALVLRHGLDTNRDFEARMAWLEGHRVAWTLGWTTWIFAALTFLSFVASFRDTYDAAESRRSRARLVSLLLVSGAVVLDLAAESIQVGALPAITYLAREKFLAVHRAAVLMTGFVANGLYTLAVLVLIASSRRGGRLLALIGWVVVLSGVAVSVTALVDSVDGLLWSNAALVPALVVWLALVARDASASK